MDLPPDIDVSVKCSPVSWLMCTIFGLEVVTVYVVNRLPSKLLESLTLLRRTIINYKELSEV